MVDIVVAYELHAGIIGTSISRFEADSSVNGVYVRTSSSREGLPIFGNGERKRIGELSCHGGRLGLNLE